MVHDRTKRSQRKTRVPTNLKKRKNAANVQKSGEIDCGIKSCDGFSDKHMGGRSVSQDDAIDVWGESGFEVRKGRVRICKSCYRTMKKEKKDDNHY